MQKFRRHVAHLKGISSIFLHPGFVHMFLGLEGLQVWGRSLNVRNVQLYRTGFISCLHLSHT
jgi:hypothetical protein